VLGPPLDLMIQAFMQAGRWYMPFSCIQTDQVLRELGRPPLFELPHLMTGMGVSYSCTSRAGAEDRVHMTDIAIGDRVLIRATQTIARVAEVPVTDEPTGAETSFRLQGYGRTIFRRSDIEPLLKRQAPDAQAGTLSSGGSSKNQ
jgi:hypothetical protein